MKRLIRANHGSLLIMRTCMKDIEKVLTTKNGMKTEVFIAVNTNLRVINGEIQRMYRRLWRGK